MTALCPSCGKDVAAALRHFNIVYRFPCPSPHAIDHLLHCCTRHHASCNEIALRLRCVTHINSRALRQEMRHNTFRSFCHKRLPLEAAFHRYLRQLSFCWGSVSAIRWLHTTFRTSTSVDVGEILQYIPSADEPARLQCYLYLEAWRRGAGGHRIPSHPKLAKAHCAAKVIQRRWHAVRPKTDVKERTRAPPTRCWRT